MATNDTVGQTIPLSIAYFDQNGNPMVEAPTPDTPPSWTNSASAVETLAVEPNGLAASALAIGAGSDTISLTVIVGGVSFSASLEVTVAAVAPPPPAQVLTSVSIVAGTPS